MKKVAIPAICALVFAACSSGSGVKHGVEEVVAKAYIFERKMLPGNKLLVSYHYKSGHALIKDSAVLENAILPQDSIPMALLANKGR